MGHGRKWKITSLTLLLALGTVAAGCSQGGASKEADKGGTGKPEAKKDITVSVYDRGNVPKDEGTVDNNRWTKWINEKGPVNAKFVPIPRNDSVQKFNTLFASGSAPDIVLEFDPSLRNQLYNQKMLMPLDDLIQQYSPTYKKLLDKYPALKKVTTMPDGKMYTIARVGPLAPLSALYIRTDWLKKLNLPVPKTADDFYNVMKAFAEKDPDGNGKKDTLGMDAATISMQILNRMFGNVGWVVKDDKLVHDWDRQQAANAYIKRLYDEGLIDKDYLTKKGAGPFNLDTEGILAGKIGIWGTYAMNRDQVQQQNLLRMLKKNDPNSEVAIIPLPESRFGRFTPTLQNPVQVVGMINANAKHPDAAMKYIDFMLNKDTAETLIYGIKGEDWNPDQDGCKKRVDPKATKTSYTNDIVMLYSSIDNLDKTCGNPQRIDTGDPKLDQLFKDLTKQSYDSYLDPKVGTFPEFTTGENLPALPDDLQQINKNVNKTINDIWAKSVVSGSSYTIDQALRDAKDAWDKAGGKKLEDWYAKWYADNKDKAFMAKDMYDFVVKY